MAYWVLALWGRHVVLGSEWSPWATDLLDENPPISIAPDRIRLATRDPALPCFLPAEIIISLLLGQASL
jgi:hypothetical protein